MTDMTTPALPDFVSCVKGNYYMRYKGMRADNSLGRLPPGTPEFKANYDRELATLQARHAVKVAAKAQAAEEAGKKNHRTNGPVAGSIDAVIEDYLATHAYKAKPHNTRRSQATNFKKLADFTDGGKTPRLGEAPFVDLRRRNIRKLIETMSPGVARPFLAAIGALTAYAITQELKNADGSDYDEDNSPVLGVQAPKRGKRDGALSGYPRWTEEMVDIYRAHFSWEANRDARLALEMLRYTGCACADVVRIGWDNVLESISGGWVVVYDRKKTGAPGRNPLWDELQAALATAGIGPDWKGPFIRGVNGKPTNAHAFSERFRRWSEEAFAAWAAETGNEAPEGSAHGVRKRYVSSLARAGLTPFELRAAGAWRTDEEASYYTRDAEMDDAAEAMEVKMKAAMERKAARDQRARIGHNGGPKLKAV